MATHKSRLTYDDLVASLPLLDPEEQVSLLEALSTVLKKALQPKLHRHSLLELEGLGSDIWSKVTVEEYIHQERDSWN